MSFDPWRLKMAARWTKMKRKKERKKPKEDDEERTKYKALNPITFQAKFTKFQANFVNHSLAIPCHFIHTSLVHEYSKFNLNFKPQMLNLSTKDPIARN